MTTLARPVRLRCLRWYAGEVRTITLLAAIVGGAISAVSCASFGTTTEPAAVDAGGLPPGTEAGAVGDAEAPLDAQPGSPLPCPPTALLCDRFEDRGGSTTNLVGTSWQALQGPGAGRIDDAMSFSASHSLAIDVAAGTSGKTLGLQAIRKITGTGVTVRAAVRLSALPQYAQLVSMVADGAFFGFMVDNGKFVVQYRDGSNASPYVPTATNAPVDRWFSVTFELRFGPTGGVRVLLDGVSIYDKAAATTDAGTVSDFRLIVDPDFGGSATMTLQPITLRYDDIVLE